MNDITMTLQADHLILEALKEDISSEDVTTNAVMKEAVKGEVCLLYTSTWQQNPTSSPYNCPCHVQTPSRASA